MFFLRRLIGRLLFVAVLGWLINKLRDSDNPRAQKVGHTANRVLGGAFGTNANGQVKPKRRVGRSAGSAAVGGLMSYFFDPDRGFDRRRRVKTFTSQKLGRTQTQRPMLPEHASAIAAGPAQSRSTIT